MEELSINTPNAWNHLDKFVSAPEVLKMNKVKVREVDDLNVSQSHLTDT